MIIELDDLDIRKIIAEKLGCEPYEVEMNATTEWQDGEENVLVSARIEK